MMYYMEAPPSVCVDLNGCMGIALRKGDGDCRHILRRRSSGVQRNRNTIVII